MKSFTFGAWKVDLWEAFKGVYQGEAVLTKAPQGVDVPSIMLEGIPFMVGPQGMMGKDIKYIFPPLSRISSTSLRVKTEGEDFLPLLLPLTCIFLICI